jgi:hypothetical protein
MFANRVNKTLKKLVYGKICCKVQQLLLRLLTAVPKCASIAEQKWFRNCGENISRPNLQEKQKLQKVTSTDNAQKYIKLLKIILFLRQNVFQHVPL